jgi:type II secretory pathway component PulM
MNSRLGLFRQWWQTRLPRQRNIMKVALFVLGLFTFATAWNWLRTEQIRLRSALPLADARFKQLQVDITEAQRLRSQTVVPQLKGQAMADTVMASIRGRKLDLTVSVLDAERLRLQGVTSFDEAVTWLGAIQKDYRLRVVSLVATRQASDIKLDVVLSAVGP